MEPSTPASAVEPAEPGRPDEAESPEERGPAEPLQGTADWEKAVDLGARFEAGIHWLAAYALLALGHDQLAVVLGSRATADVVRAAQERRMPGRQVLTALSGTVSGVALGPGAATVRSSSGRIGLAFAQRPESVTAHSSSGAVELEVPGGPYAVTTHTSSGSRSVSVPRGSWPAISVTTSSGDVVVKQA